MTAYYSDQWPTLPSGEEYDGKELMRLLHEGNNPFVGQWDPQQLIEEIQELLDTRVVDVGPISRGSNNYGIPLETSEGRQILARLARNDVNMPNFDGFSITQQVNEAHFEAATYGLLQSEPTIRAARLLYYRVPKRHPGVHDAVPKDIAGRRLLVFEKAEGDTEVWSQLSPCEKLVLLDDLVAVRAALFHFKVPAEFASRYLRERLFDFKPDAFSMPVTPTREFWEYVLRTKIEATIKNAGDMIGWEDDEETVGPVALAAKGSILRAIPLILPQETVGEDLYRLVLEHGDYGIHNTLVKLDSAGLPKVNSLFDWETGNILPAILSDPLVAVCPVDLTTNSVGEPSVTRMPKDATTEDLLEYDAWAQHYIKKLYKQAPKLEVAIRAGKDVRHLWFALRDWRGGDSEDFFGKLGAWAEERIKELGPAECVAEGR